MSDFWVVYFVGFENPFRLVLRHLLAVLGQQLELAGSLLPLRRLDKSQEVDRPAHRHRRLFVLPMEPLEHRLLHLRLPRLLPPVGLCRQTKVQYHLRLTS